MSRHDEIAQSPAARSLALVRGIANAFRSLGWRARENVAHSNGLSDVAADRVWERVNGQTHVHILVRFASASSAIFSETTREVEDVLPSYAVGDAMPSMATFAPPAAPHARVHAAAFRADDAVVCAINDSFASIEAVLRDLRNYDLEVLGDDVLAGAGRHEIVTPLARRRDLVQSIVATDASLTVFGETTAHRPWLRLHRARVVGAEDRWIDVVSLSALEKYAQNVTRYYGRLTRPGSR